MESSIGFIIRGYIDNMDTNFSNEEQLELIYTLGRREFMCDSKNWTSVSDKLNQLRVKNLSGINDNDTNKRLKRFVIYLEQYGFWNPKFDNNPNYRPSCGSQTEEEFWQDYYRYSKQRNEKRERLNKATQLIIRNYVNHENEKIEMERREIERKETERRELERRILEREKARK